MKLGIWKLVEDRLTEGGGLVIQKQYKISIFDLIFFTSPIFLGKAISNC